MRESKKYYSVPMRQGIRIKIFGTFAELILNQTEPCAMNSIDNFNHITLQEHQSFRTKTEESKDSDMFL